MNPINPWVFWENFPEGTVLEQSPHSWSGGAYLETFRTLEGEILTFPLTVDRNLSYRVTYAPKWLDVRKYESEGAYYSVMLQFNTLPEFVLNCLREIDRIYRRMKMMIAEGSELSRAELYDSAVRYLGNAPSLYSFDLLYYYNSKLSPEDWAWAGSFIVEARSLLSFLQDSLRNEWGTFGQGYLIRLEDFFAYFEKISPYYLGCFEELYKELTLA